jgi:hypothetical protein
MKKFTQDILVFIGAFIIGLGNAVLIPLGQGIFRIFYPHVMLGDGKEPFFLYFLEALMIMIPIGIVIFCIKKKYGAFLCGYILGIIALILFIRALSSALH